MCAQIFRAGKTGLAYRARKGSHDDDDAAVSRKKVSIFSVLGFFKNHLKKPLMFAAHSTDQYVVVLSRQPQQLLLS